MRVEHDSLAWRLQLGCETSPQKLSENSKFQPGKVNQTVYIVESRVLMAVFEKRLISVEDAARYLGVQKSTIYSWAWRRKIPSVKMGRRLLFDQEDLDRMIEVGKREER